MYEGGKTPLEIAKVHAVATLDTMKNRTSLSSRERKVQEIIKREKERALKTTTQVKSYDETWLESDKKLASVGWREMCDAADKMIEFMGSCSFNQDEATVHIKNAKKPIGVICLSDLHWGSYGTNHSLIKQITDEILSIPDLYVLALGDLEHMAIKLRGVNEVMDNVLPPKIQHQFTESWLEEIGHRILCATWDNHSVMREEDGAGSSTYAQIMNRKVVYHNGIGHVNIGVGKQLYKAAVTHKFRFRTEVHALHGHKKYLRSEAPDREIACAGDTHVPAMEKYFDGGLERLVINCGTTQLNSGYAKRFFSLKTEPVFPMFTLDPEEHIITPFWSIKEWLRARG